MVAGREGTLFAVRQRARVKLPVFSSACGRIRGRAVEDHPVYVPFGTRLRPLTSASWTFILFMWPVGFAA
jgi:hypothetical protein